MWDTYSLGEHLLTEGHKATVEYLAITFVTSHTIYKSELGIWACQKLRIRGFADLPFSLMSDHAQQIINTYLALRLGLGLVLGLTLD